MRNVLLFIILFFFFKYDHVIAASDERDKKPAEEQHRIIHDSLSGLNLILAEGRRRQANHATIGKGSVTNAEVSKEKIKAIGKQMEEVKEEFDKKIGKWAQEGPSKNAAVPNKGEKPLYLTASRSIREANQLHVSWVDRSNWPSHQWSKDYIAHQHASAKQVSHEAALQLHKSSEEKRKRRASIS